MGAQGTNYKDTLNLPQTEFPMRAGLTDSEPKRLARWDDSELYFRIQGARKDSGAPRYILHDGPPFANGDVHMGTALNKLLKDLVLKSKSMAGCETPYIPGWDCHGLPIEFKVVQQAHGLEPAEIRRRCEKFARKFIDIQRDSFRRLGVLGDWENPYLTLDPAYEADIIRVFAAFVEKDFVYASKKPVQWSYGAHTALAEAEVDYKDVTDTAVFVKFPLKTGPLAGESAMVIWTTTPWTLPGNLAIAVHERFNYVRGDFTHDDGRRENLVIAKELLDQFAEKTGFQLEPASSSELRGAELDGCAATHPFLDRESLLITAEFVTTETGTGAVHIAPGHGADDYMAGMAHGLDVLSPVDDEGKFTEEVGVPELVGTHVFKANNTIVEMLAESGHLLGKEDYQHSYPHCWRSKTPIIFRAVPQFFIKIDEFRQAALEEIDRVEWLPPRNRNRIYGTVEARPDWCISRQRTWGVPLPVFYSADGEAIIDADLARRVADLLETGGSNLWFEKDDGWWAGQLELPEGTTRCRDTLDVWIDSGSSHVAVCDRHPELSTPADLYLEATDQHRGWFQSSLLLSMVVRGTAPYKAVLTHGFVVDQDTGKKVSKSDQAGEGDAKKKKKVKPMQADHFISQFGADILRLWVAGVDWENEVPFGENLFKQTAETYRRIRNTLRILQGNLYDFDAGKDAVPADQLTLIDRWILERLHAVTAECLEAYEKFEFRKVYNAINTFCTTDLSSLYVDITKDRMYCDQPDSARRRASQTAMRQVFDSLCHLLAPILCYTADEAWEHAGHGCGDIHLATFPDPDPAFAGSEATDTIDTLHGYRDVIQQAIEPLRQGKEIRANNEASVTLRLPASSPTPEELLGGADSVTEFFILSELLVERGGDSVTAEATNSAHAKCPRCWRLTPSEHAEGLCGRCEAAL